MLSIRDFILEAKKRIPMNQEEQGLGLLDRGMNGDKQAIVEFSKAIKSNGLTIYAFTTNKVKNNAIKIGYTDQYPLKRSSHSRAYMQQDD